MVFALDGVRCGWLHAQAISHAPNKDTTLL
jgi:hypothetical protein